MEPGPGDSAAAEEKKEEPPKAEQPGDLKDIVTTDFMKDLVDDLGLDIDQDAMGDLMQEAGLGDKKESDPKKEDEVKKDDKKKEEDDEDDELD